MPDKATTDELIMDTVTAFMAIMTRVGVPSMLIVCHRKDGDLIVSHSTAEADDTFMAWAYLYPQWLAAPAARAWLIINELATVTVLRAYARGETSMRAECRREIQHMRRVLAEIAEDLDKASRMN